MATGTVGAWGVWVWGRRLKRLVGLVGLFGGSWSYRNSMLEAVTHLGWSQRADAVPYLLWTVAHGYGNEQFRHQVIEAINDCADDFRRVHGRKSIGKYASATRRRGERNARRRLAGVIALSIIGGERVAPHLARVLAAPEEDYEVIRAAKEGLSRARLT